MYSYFLLNKSTDFKNNISWRYIKLNLYCGLTWTKMNESLRITFYFMLLYLGQICSVGAPWCIGNYSCPILLNKALTQVLRRFKPCPDAYRRFTMVRICDSGPYHHHLHWKCPQPMLFQVHREFTLCYFMKYRKTVFSIL